MTLVGAAGAVFVVFCFNAAVANSLSVVTGRTLSGTALLSRRSVRAHGTLLAVAAAAIAASWGAAWGSGVPFGP